MSGSGWSCPYEIDDVCKRRHRPCDPGSPGCVLRGKVRFLDPAKNPAKPRTARREATPATVESVSRAASQPRESRSGRYLIKPITHKRPEPDDRPREEA